MRLAQFIRAEMESILVSWAAFAATLTPGKDMNVEALRDHAREILETIAADMDTAQTGEEQVRKSTGNAVTVDGAPPTPAQTHAQLRAQSAFDINHTVAEYRALRASVLKLWKDAHADANEDFEDMLRFNEGIDQAIAESVASFESYVEQSRNLLLGMLGHDMRSPLAAILATAEFLTRINAGEKVTKAGELLIRSGRSVKTLLDDLMDFSGTRLGMGIRIRPATIDLAQLARDEVAQLRAANPTRNIELTVVGNACGEFDPDRMQQVLRNLVGNALIHGAEESVVRVNIQELDGELSLAVSNHGAAIDPSRVPRLFDPLVYGAATKASANSGLGLGLYIVREIATAHSGQVHVHSDDTLTEFVLSLPKIAAANGTSPSPQQNTDAPCLPP